MHPDRISLRDFSGHVSRPLVESRSPLQDIPLAESEYGPSRKLNRAARGRVFSFRPSRRGSRSAMIFDSPDTPQPDANPQLSQPATDPPPTEPHRHEQPSAPPQTDLSRLETLRNQLESARVACEAARSQLVTR